MNSNKRNIMIISYIMFAYMGITFLSQGALKIEIAKSFGITTSRLQYLFTVFSTASTVTVIFNKFLLEKISLKVEIFLSSFFILIGTYLMINTSNINILIIGFILGGLGIGIYISLGNYLIINTFIKDRNRKMNFLHFSYSLSAVLTPIIAALLIGLKLPWQAVYLLFLSLVIIVIILGLKIDFSNIIHIEEEKDKEISNKCWDLKVYLSALLLFLYVFSEMIISYWIVEYTIQTGVSNVEAKITLSIFWLFIAFGRFTVGKIGHKFKVNSLVIVLLTLALLSYVSLLLTTGVFITYIVVGMLGLGFSSLYPSIISLGTDGRKSVSPNLITFIMMAGSIGGISYSPISSWINSNYTIDITMGIGATTTFIMLLLVLFLRYKNNHDTI